jgi:putative SOS response-associated peptidase YedK
MGGGVEAAGIGDLMARRPELGSRYNIRPTQDVVIIVNEDGRPVAKPMRSGMWRGPFKRSRGVVPATGFFEWKKTDGAKQPMYITPKDDEGFVFAAVYDSWINEHGETVESCAIVTTSPNGFMANIHNRMPAILDEETVALWLDPATTEANSLQSVLMPAPSESLQTRPVSTRVNSYKNDDAGLIDPVATAAPDAAPPPGQLGFPDSGTVAPDNSDRSDR